VDQRKARERCRGLRILRRLLLREQYARRAMHVTTLREIKSRITAYIRDNEYVACTRFNDAIMVRVSSVFILPKKRNGHMSLSLNKKRLTQKLIYGLHHNYTYDDHTAFLVKDSPLF